MKYLRAFSLNSSACQIGGGQIDRSWLYCCWNKKDHKYCSRKARTTHLRNFDEKKSLFLSLRTRPLFYFPRRWLKVILLAYLYLLLYTEQRVKTGYFSELFGKSKTYNNKVNLSTYQKFWTFIWTKVKKNLFFRRIFFSSSEKLTFEKENVIFFNTFLNFDLFYLIVVNFLWISFIWTFRTSGTWFFKRQYPLC